MNKNKTNFLLILVTLIVLIFFLSGCASKESATKTSEDKSSKNEVAASQQDASQLIGLWRGEKAFTLNFQTQKLEERRISALDFLEFKDKEACSILGSASDNAWGTGKYLFECSGYVPYTVSGDKIIVEGSTSPITTWRIIDGKLEITSKWTARDPIPNSKVTYRKLSESEIYKKGEPVNGKIPIRVEGTPIQN